MIDEAEGKKMTDATDGGSSLFCLIVRRGKKFNQGFRLSPAFQKVRGTTKSRNGLPEKQFQFLMCEHSQTRMDGGREGAIFWSPQPDTANSPMLRQVS